MNLSANTFGLRFTGNTTACRFTLPFEPRECCQADGELDTDDSVASSDGNMRSLYGQKISYDQLDISSIEYAGDCFLGRSKYTFKYDGNHRLMNADHEKFGVHPLSGGYSTAYTYDAAGNILTLIRNGRYDEPMSPVADLQKFGIIDQLTYTYPPFSSQLQSVKDAAPEEEAQPFGFPVAEAGYGYDAAGNMTGDAERSLTYNALNLPRNITGPTTTQNMTYLGGTVFSRTNQEDETRYYLDGLEVFDGKPESYQFGDGRLAFREGTPYFQYRITDHLGNTVVLFEDKNDDGLIVDAPDDAEATEVLQRKLYYPFGMELRGTSPVRPTVRQGYLYNGKEKVEGTGLYNYGFRYYDPAVARWNAVDPLADSYAPYSPYNYVLGNPIRNIDPDGRSVDDIIYVGNNGKVSRVEKTDDDFNVFIMESTSQVLHLNDKEGVDEKMMFRRGNFETGDRVFFPISDDELSKNISEVSGGFTWFGLGFKSYGGADFTFGHLVDNYFGLDDTGDQKVYLENGRIRTTYESDFHYFKFGEDHRLFNLYDAGNFMWGAWMNDTNNRSIFTTRSFSAAKFGSGLNELFGDADADLRAIKAGYHHKIQD